MTKAKEKSSPFPKLPDVCVRCATCMAACPVSRVTPRFPGPKQAGPGRSGSGPPSEVSVIRLDRALHGLSSLRHGLPGRRAHLRNEHVAKAKYLDERGRTFRDWLCAQRPVRRTGRPFSKIVNPLMKSRLAPPASGCP